MSIPTANSFVSQNKLLGGVLGPVSFSGPRSDQALFIKPDRLSSLKGEFGDYLSDTQYMYIISLTYNSGMPVYDLDDYDSVIEIINLIRTKIIEKIGKPINPDKPSGFEYVMVLLNNISKNVDEDMVWQMPSIDKIKKKSEHQYKLMIEEPEGKAYKGKCEGRGCLSDKFITYAKQNRSMDEPETHYAICLMCSTSFQI